MMAENKQSALPHVLVGYNANLIPPGTSFNPVEKHKCESSSYERQVSTKSSNKPIESQYRQQPASPMSGKTTAGSRSAGKKRSKKSEEKRYEELSVKWDQAKREVRLEDHEQLLEKLELQQELIRKQDEYAQQKKQQLVQSDLEKKEAEKQKKQQIEQDLKQKCRLSLEEDRKVQRKERKQKKQANKDGGSAKFQASTTSPSKSPATSSPGPGTPGSKRGFPFKQTLPAMSATPDILDSSDDEMQESMKIPTDVPWHEQQLYKLYGKQADYFLKPKMEVKEKVKKANPKLRRQGGRAGAEVLWKTLRQDSSQRLLQEDANIPSDLKEAYGSFARQSLKKNFMPVRRMYCSADDLPEMPRLLDHRKLQFMQKMRHKFDLMYRASKSNEDRTEVLTFNNPLPEFNHGMESISHYLPSWQDDFSESTQPDFLKWVNSKDRLREETILEEGTEADYIKQQTKQPTQSMDDDLLMFLSKRKPVSQKQKYVFISEKDMITKGVFSEKYKDVAEYKDKPRPYQGNMTKSYSALGGMISTTPDKSNKSALRHSAPLPTRAEMIKSYTNGWEPLSMTALVEYKKQVATAGDGDFNMGRVKMWSSIPVI